MSLRSGKEYKLQARMSEIEEAASRNSVANELVSVADLLKLLMEESKLRAEEEQQRAVREQETREAERLQREEEKQRQAERECQARDEWKAQFEMVTRLALDGRNREGEQMGRILKEAEAKVAKLTEKDDIEKYLATFERTMTAYEVNRQ